MARKRGCALSMRKVREVLRLVLQCQLENREVARSCSVAPATVGNYLTRAKEAGLSYAQIHQMEDEALRQLLMGRRAVRESTARPQPDWGGIHQELRKKGVTLRLLWEEYKAGHPEGYQLSQFYERYHHWKRQLRVSLRQVHKAGEKMFVDYAGQTVGVVERGTGEIRVAQIFVAVLGASSYTYAEATWSQGLTDWMDSHVRAFEFFGGVSQIVVPDNLRSGVSRPCRYEPDINPSYHDMAVHYNTVIIPARVRKPKDKAKVEVGVQVVERWILAALRNRTFFSLGELNAAIRELLEQLNQRPFQKLSGSRASWFETLESSALQPLPATRYVLAEWKKARVNIDYHVELQRHYYSVPYSLNGEEVEVRYTAATVEIFHRGKRVASHGRDDRAGGYTTLSEHMPTSHQQYLEWTPSRILAWAQTVGEATARVIEVILESRRHPAQGYRSCLGILHLTKQYSKDRLEAACRRALSIRGTSYKSIRSILENGLDQVPVPVPSVLPSPLHENIRGGDYYH